MPNNISKDKIVNITRPRITIREEEENLLVGLDFLVDMPIPKRLHGDVTAGWMFNKFFKNTFTIFVFMIDGKFEFDRLKERDVHRAAKILYDNRQKINHQVLISPNLTKQEILSLEVFNDTNQNQIYKIPFAVQNYFTIDKKKNLSAAFYMVPVVNSENGTPQIGNAVTKFIYENGRLVKNVKTYDVSETNPPSVSYRDKHMHYYYIDENGNGGTVGLYTKTRPASDFANKSVHVHKIINGVVQHAYSHGPSRAYHTHKALDLSKKTKVNEDVIDLRNINKSIEQESLTAQRPEGERKVNTAVGSMPKNITKTARKLEPQRNKTDKGVFSELLVSKDRNNNNKLILMVNTNNLIKRSSLYDKLPMTNGLRSLLASNLKILSLKIYRDEIAWPQWSKPVSWPQWSKPANAAPAMLIAESADKNKRLLTKSTVPYQKGGTIKTIGAIGELPNLGPDTEVRQFMVIDNNAAELTGGTFVYRAVIEVEDPVRETFRGFLPPLNTLNNDLDQLLKAGSTIDKHGNANFDKLTRRFKLGFTRRFNMSGLDKKFTQGLNEYLKIFSYFESTTGISADSLYRMIDPRMATPDTITEMFNLNKKLIDKLERLLNQYASGAGMKTSVRGAFKSATDSSNQALQRKIKVEKYFRESVFSRQMTEQRNFGYAFFASPATPGSVYTITLEDLKSRFDSELNRTGLQGNTRGRAVGVESVTSNPIGSLTPLETYIGGVKNQIANSSDEKEALNANLAIYEVNTRQRTKQETARSAEEQTLARLVEWAGAQSARVMNSPVSEPWWVRPTEGGGTGTAAEPWWVRPTADLESIIDEKTSFTAPTISTSAQRLIKQEEKLKTSDSYILSKIFNASFETNTSNANNKFVERMSKLSPAQRQQLPHQVNSLLTKSKNNETMDYSACYQQYMNLFEVEVFTGFERNVSGEISISNMKFSKLSSLDQISNNTLCRLVPYNNVFLDFKQEDVLKLPILNEYFIVET